MNDSHSGIAGDSLAHGFANRIVRWARDDNAPEATLASVAYLAIEGNLQPQPRSGRRTG